MRIAVVGTGIAGNVAAFHLARRHDITVFEAADYIGGHTNTIDVCNGAQHMPVDTGFIVFNDRTYPRFTALLDELGVASRESEMSFSVRSRDASLEYNGSTLDGLFAQRRNLVRPSFHRMVADILRFNREAPRVLDDAGANTTLGDLLHEGGYCAEFIDHYLVPMGAAIWSANPRMMAAMPAQFFVRFFVNHGLLSLDDRPTWRVIEGGSREYVGKLVAGHRDRIRLASPVRSIRRLPDRVLVQTKRYGSESFDAIFLACHSNQALSLLDDPTREEREVLGAIRYQQNDAVLHSDSSLMPRRKRAWASWNYLLPHSGRDTATLTYHMNRLQRLDSQQQYFVTLNSRELIGTDRIVYETRYEHPVFTAGAVAAQQRKHEIDGARRTFYCGAYWRYGFHEDGVLSALSALDSFRSFEANAERHLQRTG